MPDTLPDIKSRIETTKALTFNEATLGQKQWQYFTRIFPLSPKQEAFSLSNCSHVSFTGSALTFKGTFAQLFPREKVDVDVCLFDHATAVRHAVVKIPAPAEDTAYAYLSQYSVDPGESISPVKEAPTTNLGDYVQKITFGPPASMIFSTLDYTSQTDARSTYPSTWQTDIPVEHIGKGLNFGAKVSLAKGGEDDEDLDGFVQSRLTGFAVASPPHWCLIHANEDDSFVQGALFTCTRAMQNATLTAGPLSVRLKGISIVLSLARPLGGSIGPQILVDGTVTVQTTTLQVTAAFNYYHSELWLSFAGFPSLGELLTHVGLNLNSLPAPLSQMLDIKLSSLTMGVDLNDKSVSAIRFGLTTTNDIELIKDVISLKPSLAMQIYDPFDARLRSIEGDLKGTWTFENIRFKTELTYPSLDFYAGMEDGQAVSTKALVQRLLPGIALPELIFTAMEIEGNILEKSFRARIQATIGKQNDQTWGFNASGLTGITLGLVYANQQMSHCAVECTLPLAQEVGIVVSAQYDAGQDGLQFDGRTAASIDIQGLIDGLKELFDIKNKVEKPSILQNFSIDALQVSFNTQSKDFTCICDGSLTIEKTPIKGTVTIDLKHQQDGSGRSTHFSGQITIGDTLQFALIFDKTGADTRALAAYHNQQGQPQKIRNLVQHVSSDLAKAVPPSLEFTLHDAVLGYANSKWLLGVDIEGGLNLSDVKLPNFPLLSQFAAPPDQTLKLAVQVVGAKTPFTVDEVAALNALNPGGLRLPDKAVDGLALSASLRLGQEIRQLSLPIGLKKDGPPPVDGNNPLAPAQSSDVTAAPPHSGAQVVSDDGMQWVMIQKSFGPVHFERVGIAYKDGKITGLLDAALSAGGLTIALDGLSVTSPLTKFDPAFDLRGLGIDYRNGPLEIGGAFLKQTMQEGGDTYTSFAGLAVLHMQKLSLSAIGSYALKDGHPSLFIYAVLDYPLGGPAFFFVTGVAAGFGYNRTLILPAIEQVQSFPLVQQATGSGQKSEQKNWPSPPPLPAGQEEQQALLTTRLKALEEYIPRAVGEHFLAIGLRFTSFKTIDSFALLTVKFGKELEFDLLGLSTLKVPNVAEAQLALKATFNPNTGFLGVRAQLTPNSYLLSQACHLTGGFAFYSWFKDQPPVENHVIRAGDFVLTLGGYHTAYNPPAHYPRVPRLGFNWQVDPYLQLKGDAYYAMTPHALMAGGHLEATWQKDQLKAWFTAGADFLISWQPYHYDALLYVDLGASYTFDLFGSHTITADLGADLHLWGPEFAGEARIHWWIISFSVRFGKGTSTGIKPSEWEEFEKAFLPDAACGIAVQKGLIRQIQDGKQERWIVNPREFVLVTNAVIPSTAAKSVKTLNNEKKPNGWEPIAFKEVAVAVRPLGKSMVSTHTIQITKGDRVVKFDDYTPVLKAVPAALWGAPQFTDEKKTFLKPPDIHDPEPLIENTLAGFEIRPPRPERPGKTAPFKPQPYETEPISDAFQWEDWKLTQTDLQGKDASEAAIGNKDLTTRNLVLEALGFTNTGIGFLAGH